MSRDIRLRYTLDATQGARELDRLNRQIQESGGLASRAGSTVDAAYERVARAAQTATRATEALAREQRLLGRLGAGDDVARQTELVAAATRRAEVAAAQLAKARRDAARAAEEEARAAVRAGEAEERAAQRAAQAEERAAERAARAAQAAAAAQQRAAAEAGRQGAPGLAQGFFGGVGVGGVTIGTLAGAGAAVAVGQAAFGAVTSALSDLRQFVADSISAYKDLTTAQRSLRYETRLSGTSIGANEDAITRIGRNFLIDRAQATALYSQGLDVTRIAGRPGLTEPVLNALNDLAATRGLGPEDIPDLLNQIQSGGGRSIKRLLGEDPSDIYDRYAKSQHTVASALDLSAKRQALLNELLEKGSRVAGAAAERLNTNFGRLSGIQAEITNIQETIGSGIINSRAATVEITGLSNALRDLSDLLNRRVGGNTIGGLFVGGLIDQTALGALSVPGLGSAIGDQAGASYAALRFAVRTGLGIETSPEEYQRAVAAVDRRGERVRSSPIVRQQVNAARAAYAALRFAVRTGLGIQTSPEEYQQAFADTEGAYGTPTAPLGEGIIGAGFQITPENNDEIQRLLAERRARLHASQRELSYQGKRFLYYQQYGFDNPLAGVAEQYDRQRDEIQKRIAASKEGATPEDLQELKINQQQKVIALAQKNLEIEKASRIELETLRAQFASASGNPYVAIMTNAKQAIDRARESMGPFSAEFAQAQALINANALEQVRQTARGEYEGIYGTIESQRVKAEQYGVGGANPFAAIYANARRERSQFVESIRGKSPAEQARLLAQYDAAQGAAVAGETRNARDQAAFAIQSSAQRIRTLTGRTDGADVFQLALNDAFDPLRGGAGLSRRGALEFIEQQVLADPSKRGLLTGGQLDELVKYETAKQLDIASQESRAQAEADLTGASVTAGIASVLAQYFGVPGDGHGAVAEISNFAELAAGLISGKSDVNKKNVQDLIRGILTIILQDPSRNVQSAALNGGAGNTYRGTVTRGGAGTYPRPY